ncbi:hypothetical protein OE810_10870 [Rhodobacteraceae bacterium XHP0102]|nr:hypothetical protein [Rhodobacteraceae bacterium XHP0102]
MAASKIEAQIKPMLNLLVFNLHNASAAQRHNFTVPQNRGRKCSPHP